MRLLPVLLHSWDVFFLLRARRGGRGAAIPARRDGRSATGIEFFLFFDISPLRGVSSFGSKHILLSKLRSQITSPSPEPKGRLFLKKRAREVHPGARSAFRRGYRANTETQATKPNQKSEPRAEKKIIFKKRAREARPGARSALRRGYRANTVTQTTKPNQKSEPRAEKKSIFF